jgi:hypothetical protein
MSFNGNEGAKITPAEGGVLTKNYRDANPAQTLAHFIGTNKLNLILTQPGCMGIRTYHAIDENGKKAIVMVGVDADENDMLSVVLDRSSDCPANCSIANVLNS